MTTKILRRNVRRGLITRTALTIFSAMILLLSACVEEQITPQDNEKTITFSLSVPKGFTPHSYALSADGADENHIETIDVLIFDSSTGNYTSGPHYGSLAGENVTIRIPEGVTTSTHDIEVFANSRKIINNASAVLITSKTKSEILAELKLTQTGKWNTNTTNSSYIHIPMHGQMYVDAAGGNKNKASLVRMLARINVTSLGDALSTFDLKSVHLYNRNTQGYVADIGVIASTAVAPNEPLEYSGITGNEIARDIYTFEASAGSASSLSTNTCIVVGGTYDPDGTGGAYGYYRIDFYDKDVADNGGYLPIKRNHSYNVQITKIYGPGYSSAADAFASKPINIQATVKPWNESNIIDANYNGQYMLGTSAAQFSFNAEARGTTNGDNILIITTNDPGGWDSAITPVSGGDTSWLSLIDDTGGIVTTGGEGATILKLRIDENTSATRSANILFTTGNGVSYTVNVTQSNFFNTHDLIQSEANTYTLRPNGDKIMMPVSSANASSIQLGVSEKFTAEIGTPITPIDGLGMPVRIKTVKTVGVGSSGYVYVETDGSGSSAADGVVILNNSYGHEIHRWNIKVREPEANCYIVRANRGPILIPVSQIKNFKRDLTLLTSNSNAPIASGTVDENTWFDEDATFDVGLVWKDVAYNGEDDNLDVAVEAVNAVSGINGFVKVDVTGTVREGNAVVAVLQGGIIRWSWHIWVTDVSPVVSGPNGFMDRNLGSANNIPGDIGSIGLYYQWGRKDPFPTPSAFSNSEATIAYGITVSADINKDANAGGEGIGLANQIGKVNVVTNLTTNSTYTLASRFDGTNNNVDYAVANPHILYFMTSPHTLYDWYYSDPREADPPSVVNGADNQAMQNNNLWGGYRSDNDLHLKTSFDPCPAGWRIPRSSQLGTGENNVSTNGFAWNNNTSPWTGANVSPPDFENLGRTWSAFGGYYPAAGLRRTLSNGNFLYVNSHGNYWSASPLTASNNRDAGFLSSGSDTTVSPAGGNSRANGFLVRCVKE